MRCLFVLRNLRLKGCLSEHSPLLLSFKNDTGHSCFFQDTSAQCFKAWCAEVVGDADSAVIFPINVPGRKKIMLHKIVTAFPGECPQQKKIEPGGKTILEKGRGVDLKYLRPRKTLNLAGGYHKHQSLSSSPLQILQCYHI